MGAQDSEYLVPTDEQLINFASVIVAGPGYSEADRAIVKGMFEHFPDVREAWLENHKRFQDMANMMASRKG